MTFGRVRELAAEVGREFVQDDCPRLAAAIAYYTIFSLPGLLVVVVTLAGSVWGRSAVEGRLAAEISGLVGQSAASQVQTMLQEASATAARGPLASTLGIATLLFGATGAFAQLQAALNKAWEVGPDPGRPAWKGFLFKRVLSFGMVLAVGFLLLVSLALSAAVSAFGDWLEPHLPEWISQAVVISLELGLSLLVVSILFAALFKVLPDARIAWRDVGIGAVATGVLFVGGEALIAVYLGRADVGSVFGAAGSLALVLVWVYLAAMILLLGAEITQVWARRFGDRIVPEPGAVRVIETRRPAAELEA